MSRVGKKPIPAPSGVTVTVKGQEVSVKGPKGAANFRAHDDVEVAFGNGELTVKPRHETPRARALWGTTRAVIANQIKGVTQGFEKNLEMTGVGYRAAMQGKNLQMQLGYSHEIIYTPPEGVTIAVPKPTEIKISGTDAQTVGQAAAEIRSYRPPEPYKGKGVRYAGEYIRRKEGKKK
ncbi:50S ribosomal protein L6 [Terricaulis sp.]|uniref:50S ribosomal protein L6 n=1 Tax=Terricaulis sp. TaxID=2768686 RepID=UPI003782D615